MSHYAQTIHQFLLLHIQVILIACLPVVLMLVDASAKAFLSLRWETYGADTAFCGITTLVAAIVAAPWTSVLGVFTAVLIVVVHGLTWAGILKLASKGKSLLQAIGGGAVFYSAVLFALYYSQGVGV